MNGCIGIILISIGIFLCFVFPPIGIIAIIIGFFVMLGKTISFVFKIIVEMFKTVFELYWHLWEFLAYLLFSSIGHFTNRYDKWWRDYKAFCIASTMFIVHTLCLIVVDIISITKGTMDITSLLMISAIVIFVLAGLSWIYFAAYAPRKKYISEEIYELKKQNLIRSGKSYDEAVDYLNKLYIIE